MRSALPEAAYRFLTASGGTWDAPLVGAPFLWPEPPSVDELDLRKLDPGLMPRADERSITESTDDLPGSNSFAVAGPLTEGAQGVEGAALVANDMHLKLRVPNIWFRTRLIYPNSRHPELMNDVTGASLPGTPAIAVGSNRKIAWSFTKPLCRLYRLGADHAQPRDAWRYRSATG